MEKIISAMTETVTRLQTVSAWAQWQNNAEAMTKGSHEATRSSSEQEMKNMMMGINKMMLQQQQQMQKQMEMQMMMQQTMQQQTQQFMEEQTKMQQDMMKILVKGKSISEEKVSKDTGEGGRRHGLTRSGQQMPDSEHKGGKPAGLTSAEPPLTNSKSTIIGGRIRKKTASGDDGDDDGGDDDDNIEDMIAVTTKGETLDPDDKQDWDKEVYYTIRKIETYMDTIKPEQRKCPTDKKQFLTWLGDFEKYLDAAGIGEIHHEDWKRRPHLRES